MVEQASPMKTTIQEEVACSKLETRPTWTPLKPSLSLGAPKSAIASASIPKNAAESNGKHVRRAITLSADLDVAGKTVDSRSHCLPTRISRTIRGSLPESMLHPSYTHSVERRLSGLFPMDDFDRPKCRDSSFRSLVAFDAGG